MTKSISEQIRSRSDFHYGTKVYYKKHSWRVCLFQPHWRQDSASLLKDCWYRNKQIESFLDLNEGASWKTRADTSFFIYLSRPDRIPDILDRWGEDVLEIMGPVSDKHQDILLNDLTVVTRKKLWYNKFRYKISCTRYGQAEQEIFEDISDFCTDTLNSDDYKLNDTFRITSKSYQKKMQSLWAGSKAPWRRFNFSGVPYTATGTVYLRNHDDVVTLHLMYKQYITTTHKVITLDELE